MPTTNRLGMQLKSYIKDIIHAESFAARLSVLAIVATILLIRRTDSFVNPQFWAEDGPIFFLQQYENGISAIAQPYAGYLHLMPRLIAFVAATFFPYSLIASVYVFLSLIITLFVITAIFSRRLNVRYKGLLSLALVLVPHSGNKIFMSATNIQWILCILLIITAISEEPSCIYGNPRNQYISDIARIILCGLTGPFLIFLVPVFAWKWFRKTNRYNSVVILIVGLILIIQLSVISFETIELQSSHLNLDAGIYSGVIGTKTFGGLFLGSLANSINPFFLCAMYFALLGIIVSSSSHKRKLMILFLYIQLIFFACSYL